jgi:hypothetical protein
LRHLAAHAFRLLTQIAAIGGLPPSVVSDCRQFVSVSEDHNRRSPPNAAKNRHHPACRVAKKAEILYPTRESVRDDGIFAPAPNHFAPEMRA